MTERERLIELLLKCDKVHEVLNCFHERPRKVQAAELIADHLLANGVIVPPCKVGSTIYMLVTKRARVYSEPYTMIKKSKVTFGNLEV